MLYLASQSPRRRELLDRLGVQFDIIDVDVPEVRAADESAIEYVGRVAREKAATGLLTLSGIAGAVVLGADTEVVLDGTVFGKPANAEQAREMLRRLSGRTHEVLSAVWCLSAGREEHAFSITQVEFARLDPGQIAAYVACGEWQGKAGAYAIQGRAEAFVVRLAGSYSGVMGLPLHETMTLLQRFDIHA
ncbi:MAG: septum formation inhibitor Maf [Proteobacteria bacterium]|nr:septum formation inhibitor Maf [Pseudomonadota bacterium]